MSTTLSTSDKELNSSSLENDNYIEDLGMSLPSTITEDHPSQPVHCWCAYAMLCTHDTRVDTCTHMHNVC